MVEERKWAQPSVDGPEEAVGYSDLMDLIYSGGDDGQPTVMEEEQQPNFHDSGEAKAIPFVTVCEDSGELQISTEAMEFLDSMQQRKIAVVAVAGTEKTGKSFLANRYLERMQGFQTRGLLGSGTKGIWIWNKPIPVGNEVDGLLLDFQGLSVDDGQPVESGQIEIEEKLFTLILLLASQLIFNTKGHITDQTMDELALLPLMASKIRIREHGSGAVAPESGSEDEDDEGYSSDEDGDSAEFYKYFPQFNWVLRDLIMDFEHLTPKTYLVQGLEKSQLKSDQARNRNEIRRCVKDYFGGEASLNCFALVPPHSDEEKLEDLGSLDEAELEPNFNTKCREMVTVLKQNHVVKAIGERHLTGNMLLNLAMEYVESLNQNQTVMVLPAFERVVLIECERFSEKLFESIKSKISRDCSRQRMPFDTEDLIKMQSRVIKSGNQYLSEKLGRIVDCKHLVQIAGDVETRVRAYFKDIFKENAQASRSASLNFIQQAMDSGVTPITVSSVEHIQPHLLTQLKAEYQAILVHYLQASLMAQGERLGNYGSPAIFDLFQTSILDQTGKLCTDIEQVYLQALDKARAHLAEYQRQKQMIGDLVATQEATLQRQEEDAQAGNHELDQQDLMLQEARRKLKEAVDKKDNVHELNDIDMKNILVNAERQAMERIQQHQQLEHEKESLQEQVGEKQEALFRGQNQRLKDFKSLRHQQQVLQEQLEQGKKRLTSSSSDVRHVNNLYKKLKAGLDEVKVLENEKGEIQNNHRQMAQLQQEAQSKELKHIQEQNLILKQAGDRQQAMRVKYTAEISALNKQTETIEQEAVSMSDEVFTLENVLLQQTSRSQAIQSKNEQLAAFNKDQDERFKHQKSLIKTLHTLQEDQNEITEKVEVKMYESTKEKAEIGLSQEALCDFIEIFQKKLKEQKQQTQKTSTWAGLASAWFGGSSTPKETIGTQDIAAFNELPFDQDKHDVNKILAPHGIQYQI